MLINRGYRYRIYPTQEISERLKGWFRAQRYVWNVALYQRFHALTQWHQGVPRKMVSKYDQQAQLSEARAAIPWLKDVPSRAQQIVIRDLDASWKMWMRAAGRGKPRFKARRDTVGATVAVWPEFDPIAHIRDGKIRIPKIGWVDIVLHRPPEGKAKRLSIVQEGEDWFVSILCEIDINDPGLSPKKAVGIDRGVILNLADSDGRVARLPGRIKKLARRIDRLKAKNDLKVVNHRRGAERSKNWVKGRREISRLETRVRRMRRYWLHEQALYYAENYGVVVVEDLKIKNMTRSAKGTVEEPGRRVKQKSGLNRVILQQGWYTFVQMLCYKMEERGGIVVKVPPHHTSNTCSVCGHVSRQNRRSQSKFSCVECGYEENADVNAAREILRRFESGNYELVGGYKVEETPENESLSIKRDKSTVIPHGKEALASCPSP